MNLLPVSEKDNLKKGLKLRFTIVALFMLSASFWLGFVMLAPAYFLVKVHLQKTTAANSVGTEDSVSEILDLPKEVNEKLRLFQLHAVKSGMVELLSIILQYAPSTVGINSVSIAKNQLYREKDGTHILVSGTASSRDSLVSFSKLLKASPAFSSVDVPVSSLTREKNLPFAINIFIENQK